MAIVLIVKNSENSQTTSFEVNRKLIIGNSPYCDIFIDDKSVAKMQCEIAPHKSGHIVVRNLDQKKIVLINALRLKRSPVRVEDRIFIGAYEMRLDPGALTDEEAKTLLTDFEEYV